MPMMAAQPLHYAPQVYRRPIEFPAIEVEPAGYHWKTVDAFCRYWKQGPQVIGAYYPSSGRWFEWSARGWTEATRPWR